jgi:hypothetical protein
MISLNFETDEERELALREIYPLEADVIKRCNYLIEPISLEAKMT